MRLFILLFLSLTLSNCSDMMESIPEPEVPLIIIDKSLKGSISINQNNNITYNLNVTINNSIENAVEMRFRNSSGSWSNWENYNSIKSWVLSYSSIIDYTLGNTLDKPNYTVEAEFKDLDGNTYLTTDSISYIEKITPQIPQVNALFGSKVLLNSDSTCAIISSPKYDDGVSDSGRCYSFTWSNNQWNEQIITPPIGEKVNGSEFSFDICITADNNYLAISAPFNNCLTVFIYKNIAGNWEYIHKVTRNKSNFGYSLSFSSDNNYLAISAPNESNGEVYIYKRVGDNWDNHIQTITPTYDGNDTNDKFGIHLKFCNTTNDLYISSPYRKKPDVTNTTYGAILYFTNSGETWSEDNIFYLAYNTKISHISLSPNDNILAVSAASYSSNQGYVEIFKSQSSDHEIYYESFQSGDDYFGISTAFYNNSYLFIGSLRDSGNGAVYTENFSKYTYKNRFTPDDIKSTDDFSSSIHINSANNIIIGAPNHDVENTINSGAVYIIK